MVLAEMIASGELPRSPSPAPSPPRSRRCISTGQPLTEGIALGHVVLHEPRVVVTNFIADDVQKELQAPR